MDYVIKKDIKVSEFVEIRNLVGWNKINEKQIEKAIKNSMVNNSVYDNNKCIGVGRIVGDHTLKGMLTDIMVHPDYQGKGIGKIIVTMLEKKCFCDILIIEG